MFENVVGYLMVVGTGVTWVISTVTLAVAAVTLYFVSRRAK